MNCQMFLKIVRKKSGLYQQLWVMSDLCQIFQIVYYSLIPTLLDDFLKIVSKNGGLNFFLKKFFSFTLEKNPTFATIRINIDFTIWQNVLQICHTFLFLSYSCFICAAISLTFLYHSTLSCSRFLPPETSYFNLIASRSLVRESSLLLIVLIYPS